MKKAEWIGGTELSSQNGDQPEVTLNGKLFYISEQEMQAKWANPSAALSFMRERLQRVALQIMEESFLLEERQSMFTKQKGRRMRE